MKTFMEQGENIFKTQTIIRKWGNSQGIRLSKELLALAGIKNNDFLDTYIYNKHNKTKLYSLLTKTVILHTI